MKFNIIRQFPRARDAAISEHYIVWSTGRTVTVNDRASGETIFTLEKLSYMYSTLITPDESALVIYGPDGNLRLYALPSGELIKRISPPGHSDARCVPEPDGQHLIYPTWQNGSVINRISLTTFKRTEITALSGQYNLADAHLAPDGSVYLICTRKDNLNVEHIRLSGDQITAVQNITKLIRRPFHKIAFDDANSRIYTDDYNDCISLRDMSGKILRQTKLPHSDYLTRILPAGSHLCITTNNALHVLDANTLELLHTTEAKFGFLSLKLLADGSIFTSPFSTNSTAFSFTLTEEP